MRETADPVEEEGVRRALQAAADADLCVLVLDAVADRTNTFQWLGDRSATETRRGAPPLWVVYNKIDLMAGASEAAAVHAASGEAQRTYEVSCHTGEGVAQFLHALQVPPYPPLPRGDALASPQHFAFPDVAGEAVELWTGASTERVRRRRPRRCASCGHHQAAAPRASAGVQRRTAPVRGCRGSRRNRRPRARTRSTAERALTEHIRGHMRRYQSAGGHAELAAEELRAATVALGHITGALGMCFGTLSK